MRILISLVLLASAAIPATAFAQAAAPAAAPAKYSVETTDMGTLLDDPATKAVLMKYLPDMVGNAQIDMARPMTMKQLQSYAGDQVTDEVLAKVQADLDKLPVKH